MQDPPHTSPSHPWAMRVVFAIVLILLFAQIYVNETRSKPFPSILFPAGAFKVSEEHGITATDYELIAQMPNGIEESVDDAVLLGRMPEQYRTHVFADGMGVTPTMDSSPFKRSPRVISETKDWLRVRLERELGKAPTSLVVRKWRISLELRNGEITTSREQISDQLITFGSEDSQ